MKKTRLFIIIAEWIIVALYTATYALSYVGSSNNYNSGFFAAFPGPSFVYAICAVLVLIPTILHTIRFVQHKTYWKVSFIVNTCFDLFMIGGSFTNVINYYPNYYSIPVPMYLSSVTFILGSLLFTAKLAIEIVELGYEKPLRVKGVDTIDEIEPIINESINSKIISNNQSIEQPSIPSNSQADMQPIRIKPFKEWFYVNNPKMLPFAIGGLFSVISFFGFFGAAVRVMLEESKYNLFQAAFGGVDGCFAIPPLFPPFEQETPKLSASGGLIVLLIFVIALVVLSIIDFFKKKVINKKFFIYNGVRAILSLIVLILAFSAPQLVNDPTLAGGENTLLPGTGPILIGVFSIIALLAYLTGFILKIIGKNKQNVYSKPAVSKAATVIQSKPLISKVKAEVKTETVSSVGSETDTISLLKEYNQLFKEGIITKEEFDAKKKNLLK